MLLRLAYLAAADTFALLRLLPMSDRDKDIEILALRHQLLVLQRQVGKPAFTDTDRAILASLLHHLPMDKLRRFLLLVRPDTILRWHRDLLKRRHAATCVPKSHGRPPTVRSIRALVLRLASENSSWGYRRIHGELAALGIKVAASTVWEILKEHGIPPAPERHSTTWANFLRSQAEALLACDLFEVRTLTGARLYAFAVIEHSTRRIRVLGATAYPTADWIVQLGRSNADQTSGGTPTRRTRRNPPRVPTRRLTRPDDLSAPAILPTLADSCEHSMVEAVKQDVRRALAVAGDECSCSAELREAIRFLARATEDAIMVAELREEHLPAEEPMADSASRVVDESLVSRQEIREQ